VTRASILLAVQLAAFAPVWRWYAARLTDGSDEPWGIVALATAAVFALSRGRLRDPGDGALAAAAGVTGVYALAYGWLPPLVRALCAVASIALVASPAFFGRRLHLALLGLLVLSLPVIASLQFYAGWPVRLVTTRLCALLLCAIGYPVEPAGTCLVWRADMVAVDAPCSGIRMLWTGLYLTFTLASFAGFDARATWIAYASTAALVFAGNVLRTTALFFVETRLWPLPEGGHAAVGMAAFACVALGIVGAHAAIARRCA
jgi:exosortase/archaeosortase family protein